MENRGGDSMTDSDPAREEPISEEHEEKPEGKELLFLNLDNALEREKTGPAPERPGEEEASGASSVESESYLFSSFLETSIRGKSPIDQETESDPSGAGQTTVPFSIDQSCEEASLPSTLKASIIYDHARKTLGEAFSALKANQAIDYGSLEGLAKRIVSNIVAFSPEQYDLLSPLFPDSLYSYFLESFGNPYDLVEHSINVAILSVVLAKEHGLTKSELERLCLAALLHDVGMLLLPIEVWDHPRPLSENEWTAVKGHSELGRDLLSKQGSPLSEVAAILGQEHERADGSGYPLGLRSEDINGYAKIIGMVDVFEAVTHGRSHRPPSSPHQAIRKMLQEMRESFDRGMVKKLLSLVTVFPLGSRVELTTGEIGRVVRVNGENPLRPVVEVLRGADGFPTRSPVVLDLWRKPVLSVARCLDIVPGTSGERLASEPPEVLE